MEPPFQAPLPGSSVDGPAMAGVFWKAPEGCPHALRLSQVHGLDGVGGPGACADLSSRCPGSAVRTEQKARLRWSLWGLSISPKCTSFSSKAHFGIPMDLPCLQASQGGPKLARQYE